MWCGSALRTCWGGAVSGHVRAGDLHSHLAVRWHHKKEGACWGQGLVCCEWDSAVVIARAWLTLCVCYSPVRQRTVQQVEATNTSCTRLVPVLTCCLRPFVLPLAAPCSTGQLCGVWGVLPALAPLAAPA